MKDNAYAHKIMVLKAAVDNAGRLCVAREIGMKYTTLGARLNGFLEFKPDEITKIWAILRVLRDCKPDTVLGGEVAAPGRVDRNDDGAVARPVLTSTAGG